MTIQEVKEKKQQLEIEISNLIISFQKESGIFITDVEVIKTEIRCGQRITHVRVKTEI